ncbi:MAG: ATP-binding protein [Candidatus Aminicenantes bacterium]|nr:ATP-binding protein [Candidatus Aminicenantes bacterium]
MKIKEISFKNNAHTWELEPTKFSDLTLLVGASGVGKTQILNSIMKLVKISNGDVYNGVEWDLSFTGDNNENYRWIGEFEAIKGERKQVFEEKDINEGVGFKQIPKLLMEKLYLEGELVFEREGNAVIYEKKEAPKISPHKSVLNLFTTENKIIPVKEAFDKITFLDYQREKKFRIPSEFDEKMKNEMPRYAPELENRYLDEVLGEKSRFFFLEPFLEKMSHSEKFFVLTILDAPFALIFKLFIAAMYLNGRFVDIVEDFKDVFPRVEDVRFELLEDKERYELQIKERDTGWIPTGEISDGMFKTLLHIAEIKLLTPGFVVLIDEFENSLGVNCIDTVAGNLIDRGKDLQYIITSHHPYIINNIDMKHWQVVVRKGTKVSTKTPQQLKLGKSKHEAFKQLLNTEEFSEGIS